VKSCEGKLVLGKKSSSETRESKVTELTAGRGRNSLWKFASAPCEKWKITSTAKSRQPFSYLSTGSWRLLHVAIALNYRGKGSHEISAEVHSW